MNNEKCDENNAFWAQPFTAFKFYFSAVVCGNSFL